MSKSSNALLPNLPQHPPDSVQALIQVFERRTKGEPDEVVAGRVEQVSTVGGVDVEEDTRDHDRLFLQELFEEGLESFRGGLAFFFLGGGSGRCRRTRPLFKGGGRLSRFNQM